MEGQFVITHGGCVYLAAGLIAALGAVVLTAVNTALLSAVLILTRREGPWTKG